MKNYILLLIVFVAIVSCKKEEPTPEPQPTPCTTGVVNFSGKYKYTVDSFTIEWVSNKCPQENSNIYKSTDLWKVLNKYAKPEYTLTAKTYYFETTDNIEQKIGESAITDSLGIYRASVKNLSVGSKYINKSLVFVKQ